MGLIERSKYRNLLGLSFFLLTVSVIFFRPGYAVEAPTAYTDDSIIQGAGNEDVAAPAMDVSLEADAILPWRGTLLVNDHPAGLFHHDNAYVQIVGGPIIYYTSMPARKEGNLLPDMGLLYHLFSRNQSTYTLYASSSLVDGTTLDLSNSISIYYDFDTNGCTEQTVPIADAGPDQIVQTKTLVTLDGNSSYDPYGPDTAGLFYAWECYAAPDTEVNLSSPATAVTTFTPSIPGNYYFRFSVRDRFQGGRYNRSPISYVRVSVVDDPDDPELLNANAGSPQEVTVGDTVTLDGSRSIGPAGFSYTWEQTNPVGSEEVKGMAESLGSINCNGDCYKANFDADSVVDGSDLAILANNMGAANLSDIDEAMPQFVAGIARPHIFRLTVSDGENSTSETTIVAVYHPNVNELLTAPDVDPICLVP